MKLFKKALCTIFCMLATQVAHAGSVEGPHLVWINLAPSPQTSNAILREFVSGGEQLCWDDGLLLFMSERPPAMTSELVRDGVVRRNAASIRKLNALLTLPFKAASDGFDGIVVYAEDRKPMLYSLTTGKTNVQSDTVDRPLHLKGAFCNVILPTVRKP
ncbi:hypothetical protein RugamoR57_32520 [Duganella caerulea]|uniref:hypothetical protein n=1 Tax=Duganella caerulea TaxID=2885762 RepID=UPI0030E91E0D